MKKNEKLLWKPVKKTPVYRSRVFSVNDLESISPENEVKTFCTLTAPDWVIVVPVLKDKNNTECFLMVKQWRHGSARLSIEFPGGVIDEGETADDAVLRELQEETGKTAETLIHLADVYPNPAIMENKTHIYLAYCTADTKKQSLDDDEFVEIEMMPVRDVLSKMGTPPYDHALMSTALFLYVQHKNNYNACIV